MLSSILTTFQGFLSRGFWFSSFLPVALFAAVHLVISGLAFPSEVPLLTWIPALADDVVLLPLIVIGLAVVAYALRPFIPLLRGILDGTLLPTWLHDRLRQARLEERNKAEGQYELAIESFNYWQSQRLLQVGTLQTSRKKSDVLAKITDTDAISDATRKIDVWRRSIEAGNLDKKKATDACAALSVALEKNACALPDPPPQTDADKAASRDLNEAHLAIVPLLRKSEEEAGYVLERTRTRTHTALHRAPPSATRVGDARQRVERYAESVYDARFDYLWPRLLSVIQTDSDKTLAEQLTDAQSQIDFAILSLVLSLTLGMVWLPILAWTADSPWLFLAVGLINPLAAGFLYALIISSQSVFGEIVQTAIDRHRLEVLSSLHLRMPPTLAAEREIWRRLGKLEGAEGTLDLTFEHAAAK